MAVNGTWIASAVAAAGTVYSATRKPAKPQNPATPKDPNADVFRKKNSQIDPRGYTSDAANALLTGTSGNFASASLLGK